MVICNSRREEREDFKIVVRNDKDKLVFQSLDFEIMLGDMFMKCRNVREAQWLADQLQGAVEVICEEKIDEIESDEELCD